VAKSGPALRWTSPFDRSILRTPATYFMPVILGLSYVLWEKTPKEESYGVSVYAAVNQTLIFVAPVLSLGAVLEAQPLKRIWPGLTVRRTWAASLCQRLSSVLLTAAVTIVLLYGMATITAKSVSPDALWFPGLTLLSASTLQFRYYNECAAVA
jgi:hypothetical protein